MSDPCPESARPVETATGLDRAARGLARLAGLALIVMAFVVTGSAVARKFAGVSISGIDEITTYVFAAATTFAFGWTVLERTHIRIDIVRNLLPPRLRIVCDGLAWLAFISVFAVLAERAVALAVQSAIDGDRSITILRTPLVVPQAFWAFGLIFTCVAAFTVGLRALRRKAPHLLAPSREAEEELERIQAERRSEPT